MKNFILLILAAGHSRRFGGKKLDAPLNNKPVLAHTLHNLSQLPTAATLVVLGEKSAHWKSPAEELGLTTIYNPQSEHGMGTSIACAANWLLKQQPQEQFDIMIAFGDMPLLTAPDCQYLVEEFRQNNVKILQPRYQGLPGHPVLFHHSLMGELADLTTTQGGCTIIKRHPELLHRIEVNNPVHILDIDEQSDILQIAEKLKGFKHHE